MLPLGLYGPSTVICVPLVVLDNGVLQRAGMDVAVVVVDFQEAVLSHLRLPSLFQPASPSFHEEQPYGIPQPQELLAKVVQVQKAISQQFRRRRTWTATLCPKQI